MTVSIFRDIEYPVLGDTVTLAATGIPDGYRLRFRLMAVPGASKIDVNERSYTLITTGKENGWLDNNKLVPDVEGRYDCEVALEQYVGKVPHFSNDTVATDSQEWDELYGGTQAWTTEWTSGITWPVSYPIYVGRKMRRTLGIAPDTVVLESYFVAGPSDTSGGVPTDYYKEELRPTLVEPSSSRAVLASTGANVIAQLARMGGKNYTTGTTYGSLRTKLMTSAQWLANPYNLYADLVAAFNGHITAASCNTHAGADAVNVVAVANCTVLADMITLINDIKAKYEAHRVVTPAVHAAADAVNVITAANAATLLSEVITLYNDAALKYETHRVATVPHGTYADGYPTSRLEYAVVDTNATIAQMVVAVNDMKSKYNSHAAKVTAATYHAAGDSDNETTVTIVSDPPGFIKAMNDLADLFGAHATNIKWSDKSAASYHTVIDAGGDTTKLLRATDMNSAVLLLEYVIYLFMRHVDTAGAWHTNIANAGEICITDRYLDYLGTAKLHKLYLDAVQAVALGSAGYAIQTQVDMLAWGGFENG